MSLPRCLTSLARSWELQTANSPNSSCKRAHPRAAKVPRIDYTGAKGPQGPKAPRGPLGPGVAAPHPPDPPDPAPPAPITFFVNFVVVFWCKFYTSMNFRSSQLFSQGERNLRISGPRVRERSPRKIFCLQGRGWESFLIIFARGCQRVCLSVSLFASKRLILMSWLKIRV